MGIFFFSQTPKVKTITNGPNCLSTNQSNLQLKGTFVIHIKILRARKLDKKSTARPQFCLADEMNAAAAAHCSACNFASLLPFSRASSLTVKPIRRSFSSKVNCAFMPQRRQESRRLVFLSLVSLNLFSLTKGARLIRSRTNESFTLTWLLY